MINVIKTSSSWGNLVEEKALGYDLAEDWIAFWTYFMIIALILSIYLKQEILVYKGLLYIIPIFAITIIRRNVIGSFKYLLSNICVLFIVYISCFTLIEKEVFLVPIILYFITSIKKRNSKVIEFYDINMLLRFEIYLVICYFIALNYNLTLIMNLINFASINIAITFVLYVHIMKTSILMKWEGEFIKGYSKRMKQIKINCIVFISGLVIFFILIAKGIGLYKLFDILTIKILIFLNGSYLYNNSVAKTNSRANSNPHSLIDPIKKFKPVDRPSHLITTILNIIEVVFYVTLFLLFIYLLFRMIVKVRDFYRTLNLKKTYIKEEKESVFSLDDIIEEIKGKVDKIKVKLELPFNTSNSKKIRKMYYKLIKSYKTKEILAEDSNTPMEIENKVKRILERNISEATAIYEKARYSDIECSNDDVDKMKSFLER